jgi:Uma2 family endonuclease
LLVATPGVIFSDLDSVIPDLVFISNDILSRTITGERITAAPDLVIEILSPGLDNAKRGRIAKRQLYGRFGVLEYWIVDLQSRAVEIYSLDGQVLRHSATLGDGDMITSSVLSGYNEAVSTFFAT